MPTAMPCAYNLLRAVLWNTSAILLGFYTCFIYDFEKQTWQEREQFETGVIQFGLVLHGERIYVAGGGDSETDEKDNLIWTRTDEIKSVPVVDIIENKFAVWKLHAKLPQPGNVQAFGVLVNENGELKGQNLELNSKYTSLKRGGILLHTTNLLITINK